MKQGQFKGFEDIVIRDGLWAFKGETVWSGDITELWKWVELSIRKLKDERSLFNIKVEKLDFEYD